MTSVYLPQRLNVAAFAQDGALLTGTVPLSTLSRLAQEAASPGNASVQWSARGELQSPTGGVDQVWLHLEAEIGLPMVCQRCMTELAVDLHVEREFRFVADEETAMAMDDEAEEDLLVLDHQFNLIELVEDELLMALPAVPRHVVCPVPVQLHAVDADFDAALDDKPHPFAVLHKLKIDKDH